MNPLRIDHANVFDDFTDVLVEIELNETDKKKIWEYNQKEGYRFYCKDNVSMFAWVNVENKETTGINYVAYYPDEHGETPYPIEELDDEIIIQCLDFVENNYFGNEEKYDDQ